MVHDIALGDIMIRHVATISQDEKITTAAKIMALKNIGSIVVVDKEKLLGILTEKDFLKKVIAEGLDPNKIYIKDVMTSNIKTASPEESIFNGYKIMKDGKFRRLPIVDDNGKLVGIVTETDVSHALHNFASEIKPKTEDKKIIEHHLKKHYELDKHGYIISEEKPNKIFDIFMSLLSDDYAGFGIVRQNASIIKQKYGFEETMFLWLTTLEGENTIKPTDIEKLQFSITSFMNNAEKSVILIDGIEYMINYTSFKEVLHMLQSILDKATVSNSIILLSIDPETLDRKEYKLILRSFDLFSA